MPFTRVEDPYVNRMQHALPVLARLAEVGVLPVLKPGRRDSLYGVLRRLDGQHAPLEHLPLLLSWYRNGPYDHGEIEPGPSELILSLSSTVECRAFTTLDLRDELAVLHPWLYGSLLYHVSDASDTTYPIYTARDAIADAEVWDFQGDLRGFWHDLAHEFQHEKGRSPAREELRRFAEEQRGTTPKQFLNLIGQAEWVPVLSTRRRLSLPQMRAVAQAHPEQPSSHVLLEILDHVEALHRVSRELLDLQTDEDHEAWQAHGEGRISPVASLSASTHGSRAFLHAVQERLEDTWQMAAQTEGFLENLLIRLQGEADAERAAHVLRLHGQAWTLVVDLVHLLADPEDW
ncbi:hypothetical protein [Deinococcus aluminii]|uniref:Uncharacterized protein n=1 Tax=Deinococcus aluminii TaxID=1656885 RepID=A0ABP9XHI7_9DEIO